MGRIVAGLASSHAYIFVSPDRWDERRTNTRGNCARRYGVEPPDRPEAAAETLEENQRRYENLRQGLFRLRSAFAELQPDSWVLIGDDQDENYREDNLPQFAIYVGDELITGGRDGGGDRYQCDAILARTILHGCVDSGIDLASSNRFEHGLISHAHRDVMRFLDPDGRVPVVPFFVNAIHVPAPAPRRCYELGRAIRQAIEAQPDDKRVVIYASGGWSHFKAGLSVDALSGPPHPRVDRCGLRSPSGGRPAGRKGIPGDAANLRRSPGQWRHRVPSVDRAARRSGRSSARRAHLRALLSGGYGDGCGLLAPGRGRARERRATTCSPGRTLRSRWRAGVCARVNAAPRPRSERSPFLQAS